MTMAEQQNITRAARTQRAVALAGLSEARA